MLLIPAIDIRHGRCVRLYKGDFNKETRYQVDPVSLATRYRDLGASWLHVVDLDGAKKGSPVNLDLVKRMTRDRQMQVQLGGGIREGASLDAAMQVVDRIVIGSLAVSAPDLVCEWFRKYGAERFTLAFDVRIDSAQVPRLTTHGWTRMSDITLDDALERFSSAGLVHVLCTDVDKDGAMEGPNASLYETYCGIWPQIKFQASGGIRDLPDIEGLSRTGVSSAISGRALLDGKISDAELGQFLQNE